MRRSDRVKCVFLSALMVMAMVPVLASAAGGGESLPFLDTGLSFDERAADLVSKLTLEEKMGLFTHTGKGIPRLGIKPYYYGNEALHGVVRPGEFTVFPMAIALGSTWDPDLIRRVTTAISDEELTALVKEHMPKQYEEAKQAGRIVD